jgi:hypothetical protein
MPESTDAFLARMILDLREGMEVTSEDMNRLKRVAAGEPDLVEPPSNWDGQ